MICIYVCSFFDIIWLDEDGQFIVVLLIDIVVGIEVYVKGYFLESKMLKMWLKIIFQFKLELQEVKVGVVVDIEELFFVGNEVILLLCFELVLFKIL